jgi:transposase
MLRHRHKLVGFRTPARNQFHALAMRQGLCRKQKLWTIAGRKELEALNLDPWASRRRQELLQLLDQLDPWIKDLDRAVIQGAERHPGAVQLMKRPGVGPVTALAFVLTIGPINRFPRSKQVVSYLGLNPSEESSGGKQRLGAISKQGNTMAHLWPRLDVPVAFTATRTGPRLRCRDLCTRCTVSPTARYIAYIHSQRTRHKMWAMLPLSAPATDSERRRADSIGSVCPSTACVRFPAWFGDWLKF